ncbi:MAG: FAD-dependent oxidoreductase [bacterium]|nr:FAD-dependent oxidoreductase [bacterium]
MEALRIAVVGAGPAGFYTVQHLLRQDRPVEVDLYDRLHTPFGLVRHGVAPDHLKIKSVIAVYHKLALDPRMRFFGNVDFGTDVTLDDLKEYYHQIVLCTGAQTDRRLGIPGEDLAGSHPATEFVAWYNGHPDYSGLKFDLDTERAVVVGVGNVAVDVARILCRTREELLRTDIADYALDAIAGCRIREVVMLGRRGPAQAAFTNPEVKELGELEGADALTLPDEMRLDPLSARVVEEAADKKLDRKLELLNGLAGGAGGGKPKRLTLRFLASPVEILGDESGAVRGVRIERNELLEGDRGKLKSRGTGEFETLDAGLVFRSVGYRGVPLPGVPFNDDWGTIPNETGRILDDGGAALRGLYVSGWIKRGPSGVIGTNKPDAKETVSAMLEDASSGTLLQPVASGGDAIVNLLRERSVAFIDYAAWQRLDALELDGGKAAGRPRVKFTRREEFERALAD